MMQEDELDIPLAGPPTGPLAEYRPGGYRLAGGAARRGFGATSFSARRPQAKLSGLPKLSGLLARLGALRPGMPRLATATGVHTSGANPGTITFGWPGLDAGSRQLLLAAAALGGLLVLLVGGWSLFGHHGGPVPIIAAQAGPVRVRPLNRGGMQIMGANDEVLSGKADGAADAADPLPEQPDRQALQAQSVPPQPAGPVNPPLPATAAATIAPPPVAALPMPPEAAHAAPNVTAAHVAAVVGAPHVAAVVGAPHVAAVVGAPHVAAVVGAPHVTAVVGAPHVTAAHGAMQVQLAALGSAQAAQGEWARLAHRMPDLFAGRRPSVLRADHDGHAVYRLRVGGFADMAQAGAFCQRVRAKGAGCAIADF